LILVTRAGSVTLAKQEAYEFVARTIDEQLQAPLAWTCQEEKCGNAAEYLDCLRKELNYQKVLTTTQRESVEMKRLFFRFSSIEVKIDSKYLDSRGIKAKLTRRPANSAFREMERTLERTRFPCMLCARASVVLTAGQVCKHAAES